MKSALFLFVSAFVGNILNYLYSITIARILGPADYSVILSLLSLLIIMAVPINTFQTVVTKYVSSFKALEKNNIIKKFLIKAGLRTLIFGISSFLILLIFSKFIADYLKLSSVLPVIIICSTVLPAYVIPITRGALQGFQAFVGLGLNGIFESAFRFLIGIVLLFIGLKVNGVLLAFPFSLFLAFVLSILPLSKFLVAGSIREDNDTGIDFIEVYKYIFPVFITLFSFAVLTNIDVIMVKHYFDATSAGYYASAEIIGKIGLYLAGPVAIVMFPKTSFISEKNEDAKPVLIKSIIAVACICGVLAFSYLMIPDILIKIFFGSKFINSIPLLPKFGIAMFLFSLTNVFLFYQLSIRSFKFIIPLIICALLEIILITLFHNSLDEVISMLIISGLILVSINYFLVFRVRVRK